MRSLLIFLLALAAPLAAQTLTGAVETAASDPVMIPAAGDQGAPALATDGTLFFAVWQDSRLDGMIFGARIGFDGRLLDPTGIPLSALPGAFARFNNPNHPLPTDVLRASPSVTWNGQEFAVVWRTAADVRMTRVRPDGTIVAQDIVLLSAPAVSAALGWNGTNLLLAYSLAGTVAPFFDRVFVRLISTTGEALSSDALAASSFISISGTPLRIIASRAAFLLLSGWGVNITATIIDAAGRPGRSLPANIGVFGNPAAPRVASDGTSFVMDTYSGFARLDQQGNQTASSPGLSAYPFTWVTDIVWTGTEYDVISGNDVAIRYDRDLRFVGGRGPISGGFGVAISNGSQTVVVRRSVEGLTGTSDLTARFIDSTRRRRTATGGPSQLLLTTSAVPQLHPAAASNGRILLIAWYEPKENQLDSRVMASRVTADGQHLDGRGIVLSEGGTPAPGTPLVGSDGDGFVVVWDDAAGPRASIHLGADGSRTAYTNIPGEGNWYNCRDVRQSIAFDGSNYLLVSQCGRGADGAAPVLPAHALRISRNGLPLGGLFPLSVVPGYDPKLVWTGTDFFAAREDSTNDGICGRVTAFTPATPAAVPNGSITIGGQTFLFTAGVFFGDPISLGADVCLRNVTIGQGQIYRATVTGSAPSRIIGTFVMPSGVIRKDIVVASGSTAKTQAALATNGRTIFAIWKEGPQDTPGDLYGRIFSLDGEVLAGGAADTPGTLLTAGVNSANPSVAWDGAHYVLAWESTPAGSTTSDLLIRRFREDGSTPDPAPVVLSATPFTDDHVQLVPFGTALAAVYTREAIEPAYGSVGRVFVRTVP